MRNRMGGGSELAPLPLNIFVLVRAKHFCSNIWYLKTIFYLAIFRKIVFLSTFKAYENMSRLVLPNRSKSQGTLR